MPTLTIRLPESLHKGVKEAAQKEGISINQFIALTVAEKLSAWNTEAYLNERAARASRETYEAALVQVPNVLPEEYDRIS